MSAQTENADISADPTRLRRLLNRYRSPNPGRSMLELGLTAIPLLLIWALAWVAVSTGHWFGLLLTVPAAAFLVRLFMIQHDCAHHSFFHSRRANDWTGRMIGVLTLTHHDFWRYTHARHHAGSGNLDRPRIGEIDTQSLREYQRLIRGQRLRHRLYRHPLELVGLGPVYLFLLDYRLPPG